MSNASADGNETTSWMFPPALPVQYWWGEMVAFSLLNMILFAWAWVTTAKHVRRHPGSHAWSLRYSKGMRLLAFPFVFECTFRSFLPSLYNKRQTLIEGPVASILIARCLAAVGEICFGIQLGWALANIAHSLPYRASKEVELFLEKWITRTAILIVALATIAQFFSYAGMVTTNYVYVVVEETLWACIFFLGSVCCFALWHFGCDDWTIDFRGYLPARCRPKAYEAMRARGIPHHHDEASIWIMRVYVRVVALFGVGATPFMIFSDVPKWYVRYRADEDVNKVYMSPLEGLYDAAHRQEPTQIWEDWVKDWFWMSGYFAFASMLSVALMFAPGRVKIEVCNCPDHHINRDSLGNQVLTIQGESVVVSGYPGSNEVDAAQVVSPLMDEENPVAVLKPFSEEPSSTPKVSPETELVGGAAKETEELVGDTAKETQERDLEVEGSAAKEMQEPDLEVQGSAAKETQERAVEEEAGVNE